MQEKSSDCAFCQIILVFVLFLSLHYIDVPRTQWRQTDITYRDHVTWHCRSNYQLGLSRHDQNFGPVTVSAMSNHVPVHDLGPHNERLPTLYRLRGTVYHRRFAVYNTVCFKRN